MLGLGMLNPFGLLNPFRWIRRIAFTIAVGYFALTFLTVWMASTRDDAPVADAIVVLGAAQYNGKPSPVLQARLDHALDLYRRGVAKVVVVTGGRKEGDRTTEAGTGAVYLLRHGRADGLRDGCILREVQGASTYSSLAAVSRFGSSELARCPGHPSALRSVVFVSDAYHSARVAAIARELAMAPHTSPVPGSAAPMERLLKESAAVAVGNVVGYRRMSELLGH